MPQVNLNQAVEDLNAFLATFSTVDGVDGIELFLHREMPRDEHHGWYRLNTSEEFRNQFASRLIPNVVRQYSKEEIVSYEYDAIVDEVIGVAPSAVFPGLSEFVAQLPPRALERVFDSAPDEFDRYKTRAIALHNAAANETAYLVSRRNSFDTLNRKFLARFGLGDNEFTPVNDNTVSFGYGVDFIVWRNTFFVDKDFPFQNITGFDDLMREKSNDALQQIGDLQGVSIVNMDELTDCVNQYSGFRRKMAAAFNSGAFDNFDSGRATNTIDENELPVEYEFEDGEVSFEFDLSTAASRNKVIDLLSDNYVRGQATGLGYIASRKRPV